MRKYCVNCGYYTATEFVVCADCALVNGVAESFVPATCGDDVCYLEENGELNLDGDCSHSDDFDLVFAPELR